MQQSNTFFVDMIIQNCYGILCVLDFVTKNKLFDFLKPCYPGLKQSAQTISRNDRTTMMMIEMDATTKTIRLDQSLCEWRFGFMDLHR